MAPSCGYTPKVGQRIKQADSSENPGAVARVAIVHCDGSWEVDRHDIARLPRGGPAWSGLQAGKSYILPTDDEIVRHKLIAVNHDESLAIMKVSDIPSGVSRSASWDTVAKLISSQIGVWLCRPPYDTMSMIRDNVLVYVDKTNNSYAIVAKHDVVVLSTSKLSDDPFPHECLYCGQRAYVGFTRVIHASPSKCSAA